MMLQLPLNAKEMELYNPTLKALMTKGACALLLIFTACKSSTPASPTLSGSSTSPVPISITQPDGSTIMIVGKGNMDHPYTETIDGYTILRNNEGVYEYAKREKGQERLSASGVKAHDPKERSSKEIEFLKGTARHLRNLK